METYLHQSASLHRVAILIDLTTGVQDSDKMLLDLLIEKTKTITLILTKVDKVKAQHVQTNTESVISDLQKAGLTMMLSPIVHLTSSYTGYGLHELMCGLCHTYS